MANPDEVVRSSIGGYPVLPDGESWPVCTEDGCNHQMSLFFQTDLADGATLGVFQCLNHDDPFETLDTLSPKKKNNRLPKDYWEHQNYAILLSAADAQQQLREREPSVGYSKLVFTQEPEPDPQSGEALNFESIKMGGSPFWVQAPRIWSCSCGSEMEFVCSMPENLLYPKAAGAPRQTNGRQDSYFLFLGLSTYIFACKARCNPRAVVAVRQN
jgi:hypothetical protein